MARQPHLRVANPPTKPLMVFDGDCHFCRRWLARWRDTTVGEVDYEALQEAAERFPEIPRADFEQAVKFIETDGRVFSGADAVYQSLRYGRGHGRLRWSYDHLPGFAGISEAAYAFIARHRELALIVTNLFWGKDVRQPTFLRARHWFLRALGAIYLIAFLSFWVQVDGLIGTNGISPLPMFLKAAHEQLGQQAYLVLPTFCWFGSSDRVLHFLCGAGAVISLLLIVEIVPVLCLIALFALYLSVTIAGQTFLSFQWDILLLETGFLAIFLAPLRWRSTAKRPSPVSRGALFLLHFLLFKLMLMSGVVKLTSGDASWWNLTALDYHYWTQPLPTVGGWWAAQRPEWFQHSSTAFVLSVEILAPFLIWLPRRLRLIGCGALVLLQILIAATGNYCFFNLLTVALCLLLVDDAVLISHPHRDLAPVTGWRWPPWIVAIVMVLTLPSNAMLIFSGFKPDATWPRPMELIYSAIEPFHIANGYGLFRVMTKDRPEIVIEGSTNGLEWKPYEFKWKPGPLDGMPQYVAPHQPRLDWQMWFAALSNVRQQPWFQRFLLRLLENSSATTRLLARNPFPNEPPRYVRAKLYKYEFTTASEHAQSGNWWKREDAGLYCPPIFRSGR